MEKIKILVVDDHAIIRDSLRALLRKYNDIEIIGEASDGVEAIEKVRRLFPDVAVVDIEMPKMNGLEATRHILNINQKTKVLILTQHESAEYIISAIKAGANGYLTKRAMALELVTAIRTINSGESYLSPSAATIVVKDYLAKEDKEPIDCLSDREREILKLTTSGRSSREISAALCISLKTVNGYRTSIMKKLNIHNQCKLVRYGISKGLVSI